MPSAIPDFHAYVLAVKRVERLLRKVAKALDDADIPYAVVGGNAVAIWVETVDDDATRTTRDVDVLLRRRNLSGAAEAFSRIGLMHVEVLGLSMFVDRRTQRAKSGVHIVFANELVRPEHKHAAPDVDQSVRGRDGIAVVDLPSLVLMKLQAFRAIDRVHIEDLLSVDLIDHSIVCKLPRDMASRLREIERTRR
jgi:hypothetical protein